MSTQNLTEFSRIYFLVAAHTIAVKDFLVQVELFALFFFWLFLLLHLKGKSPQIMIKKDVMFAYLHQYESAGTLITSHSFLIKWAFIILIQSVIHSGFVLIVTQTRKAAEAAYFSCSCSSWLQHILLFRNTEVVSPQWDFHIHPL